jgi:hypothetical protein
MSIVVSRWREKEKERELLLNVFLLLPAHFISVVSFFLLVRLTARDSFGSSRITIFLRHSLHLHLFPICVVGSTLQEEFYGMAWQTIQPSPGHPTPFTFHLNILSGLIYFLFLQPVHNFCHHYVDWETFYLFISMARRRMVGSAMSQLDTTTCLADRILFDTIMRY